MSEKEAKSQFAEVQEAIKTINQDAYRKYPLNSAFPVGCDERAEFTDRQMAAVKKRFPAAFK